MPVKKPTYTPIIPRGGGLIHATTLTSPSHTACGLPWSGWLAHTEYELTCTSCVANLYTNKSHGVKAGKGRKKQ